MSQERCALAAERWPAVSSHQSSVFSEGGRSVRVVGRTVRLAKASTSSNSVPELHEHRADCDDLLPEGVSGLSLQEAPVTCDEDVVLELIEAAHCVSDQPSVVRWRSATCSLRDTRPYGVCGTSELRCQSKPFSCREVGRNVIRRVDESAAPDPHMELLEVPHTSCVPRPEADPCTCRPSDSARSQRAKTGDWRLETTNAEATHAPH